MRRGHYVVWASRAWFLPLVIFAATLAIYVATLPPSVLPGDSGELIAVSHTLSIAHPPGYPLYVMLGKIFASIVAVGSVAYRYNLLSAVLAAATAALGFGIMRRLGVGRLPALAVTLVLATLEAYWFQATAAEVYALNGFFAALLLYLAFSGRPYGDRTVLLLGFVGGLAISHHLSLAYPLVVALVIFGLTSPIRPRPVTWLVSGFMLALGLTIWLYIPIRAHLGPPITWGATDTISGFLSHITAQTYRWRLRALEPWPRTLDFLGYFKVLAKTCGIPLISLGSIGLAAGLRRWRETVGLLLLVVLYGFHYAAYNIPDIETHVLPAALAVAILAGMALERLRSLPVTPRLAQALRPAVTGFAFVLVGLNLVALEPRRDPWFAYDYAEAIQKSARDACGGDCVIVASGDISLFSLLYVSYAEPGGVRVFDPEISNPRAWGLDTSPRTIEESVAALAGKRDLSRIAILGVAPPAVMGEPTAVWGMVYVVGDGGRQRLSPLAYPIRDVGRDPRDYYSRLLASAYYFHLARWHLAQGDSSEARASTAQALAAAPGEVAGRINAARLFVQMAMPDEALRLAREATRIDPDFFEAHDMLAHLLAGLGQNGEAIAEYRLALTGNPNPGPVYSNLGFAYLAQGDPASAEESFARAIGLDSTLTNAYVGLGRASESRGDFEEALTYYRRARVPAPGFEPACHAEAALLMRMNRHDEARGVIATGLASNSKSAFLLSDLGLISLREGDLDSAITYLGQALAIDPSMLAVRGNLAVAYEERGFKQEAARQYRIYLETAPPGQARTRASEALNRLTSG